MLNAVLVDDEESSLSALKEKIGRHCPQVNVSGCFSMAEKAIEAINNNHPNLVFLDIEMPVMNGFLLLQRLQFKNFELIFTTAYDHYAIKAIRYSALDYLVKPIEIEELQSAVQRAEEKRKVYTSNQRLELLLENLLPEHAKNQKIAVPHADGLQFIKVSDIVYLEANVNYTHIFLKDGHKVVISRTLKEFEDLLPSPNFLRIHHSFIINRESVEKYIRGEGGQVVLSNGAVLEISRRKKAEFLKAIGH